MPKFQNLLCHVIIILLLIVHFVATNMLQKLIKSDMPVRTDVHFHKRKKWTNIHMLAKVSTLTCTVHGIMEPTGMQRVLLL